MYRNCLYLLILFLLISCMEKQQTTDSPIEGYISVTGGKVWYRIVGHQNDGIPLLVIHGGPGAPHDYLETLEKFADERPVIFYDQLGCGNSERPSDTTLWTVERFVDELETVRNTLKLDKVHILGQSWGSMLAVEYLLRKNPEGVVSLILSAPYLNTEMWEKDQAMWVSQLQQDIQDAIYTSEKSGQYDSWEYINAMHVFYQKHVCRMDPWPDCLNRALEKMGIEVYHYMWGPSEFTMTGILKHADLTGQLSEIKIPTLFTCGEFDESTPESAGYFQSKLPGSILHVFEGASHMHHLESEAAYRQVVTDFIHKQESFLNQTSTK